MSKGWIMVREIQKDDLLHNLRTEVRRNLGTCVIPLSLTAAEDGWIVKVGVIRTKLTSTKTTTKMSYRYHEINEPVFLRFDDGHYYLQYHETWRDKSTTSRKEYKIPKWHSDTQKVKS